MYSKYSEIKGLPLILASAYLPIGAVGSVICTARFSKPLHDFYNRMSTKSWGVVPKTTKLGETLWTPSLQSATPYIGIPIREENRATVFETRKAGIEILQKILRENYLSKGVHAVLAGIPTNSYPKYKYAIFVENDFLREIPPE